MNQELLNKYEKLGLFLSSSLGNNVEIVIQSVSPENSGIVAIFNGNVSGRKIGDPLTRFALKMIEDEVYKEKDFLVGYKGRSKDSDKVIRSSTYFIKDEKDSLVGMFCINRDITEYKKGAEMLLSLAGMSEYAIIEEDTIGSYTEDISDTIQEIIEKLVSEFNISLDNQLSKNQKIKLISGLKKKGVFNVKGSVVEVAAALNISEPSVYRYLSKIK